MIYMYVRFSTFGYSRVIPYASNFTVFTLDIEKNINTYFELNILLYFTCSFFHLLCNNSGITKEVVRYTEKQFLTL